MMLLELVERPSGATVLLHVLMVHSGYRKQRSGSCFFGRRKNGSFIAFPKHSFVEEPLTD